MDISYVINIFHTHSTLTLSSMTDRIFRCGTHKKISTMSMADYITQKLETKRLTQTATK